MKLIWDVKSRRLLLRTLIDALIALENRIIDWKNAEMWTVIFTMSFAKDDIATTWARLTIAYVYCLIEI